MVADELQKILNLLGIRVQVKRHNGWWIAPCPFAPWNHRGGKDLHPSFGVKVEDTGVSAYKCLTCGSKGTITLLVRRLAACRNEDSTPLELAVVMAESTGMLGGDFDKVRDPQETPTPVNEAAFGDIYPKLAECLTAEPLAYVVDRGIHENTADYLDLRYDPEQHRILFPVRGDNQLLYGFTGRAISDDTEPKVRDYLGLLKRALLLGAHLRLADLPVVVVEGLFGWASLVDAMLQGDQWLCTPVAIMGNQLTEQQASTLCRWNERTYLLLDMDEGGEVGLFGPRTQDGLGFEGGGAIDLLVNHVPVYVPGYPESMQNDIDNVTVEALRDMLMVQPVATRA